MAPSFVSLISCCQMKMVSATLLEAATELDGIQCFLPIHCLPDRKKDNIRRIIETGFSTILEHAKKRSFLQRNFKITQKRQDLLDPILSTMYNTYSLASGYTKPYSQDSATVHFKLHPKFIAEGECDHVQVEILIHQTCEITMFIWREIEKASQFLCLRFKKSFWRMKLLDSKLLSFQFYPEKKQLFISGKLLGESILDGMIFITTII